VTALQGISGEKKQRKSGIYQKSVKKEGCQWPLSEAKVPERPLFSRVLSHKTMFFFYFAFMLNPWPALLVPLKK